MKKINVILIIMFLVVFTSTIDAQIQEHTYGKISQQEADMLSYEKDPDASAVVLYDKGESKFREVEQGSYSSFNIFFTRTKRVKIFKKEGYSLADIKIDYYTDGYDKTESVRNIKAASYNYENGQLIRTDLADENIFSEEKNDYWSSKKFAIPNVKEGSIIEYTYELETPFKSRMPDWEFQSGYPTVYSEYSARMIPFFSYAFIAQGIFKFDYQKSELDKGRTRKYFGVEFQDFVSQYVMTDVPAFQDESYISSIDDYIIKIDFQISQTSSTSGLVTEHLTTWPKLNSSLLKNENFGKYLNSCEKNAQKSILNNLELIDENGLQKAKVIIDYVKNNFTWNRYVGKYTSQKAQEVIDTKKGSVPELNLLLIGLLRSAGYEADPIILSTRDHGKIKFDYPFEHFFNYVIALVKIGDRFILADASDALTPFNKIPANCLNEKGLIVQKEGDSWVNLNDDFDSSINEKITLYLDPEQEIISVKIGQESTGYDAVEQVRAFGDEPEKITNEFSNKGFENIVNVKSVNNLKTNSLYELSLEAKYPLEVVGDLLYVSPFLNFPMAENKLRQAERKYPVDMIYKKKRSYSSSIYIPNGYELESKPDNYKADNELLTLDYNLTANESEIKVEGFIDYKKSSYSPSEYAKLKSYFSRIVKQYNEKIVLKKKTG